MEEGAPKAKVPRATKVPRQPWAKSVRAGTIRPLTTRFYCLPGLSDEC